ncbi:hypothetical protein BKA70DRAFT_1540482 [Coprinopsis sp. MPI-PUGE-AT-0042]|nr:hypothetical protein BKA70DRAFT_1540482 [Coprinopsis sp. MPI-PUGE-AT-0042]
MTPVDIAVALQSFDVPWDNILYFIFYIIKPYTGASRLILLEALLYGASFYGAFWAGSSTKCRPPLMVSRHFPTRLRKIPTRWCFKHMRPGFNEPLPGRPFYKYYKDRHALVAKEDPIGQHEFELTDFTNNAPRRLEMSTLKGVGRLIYRAGRRKSTSTFKISTNASSDSDSSDDSVASDRALDVHESPFPHQEMKAPCRNPRRHPDTATRRSVPSSPRVKPVSHFPARDRGGAKPN